ncbi:hypothetical protein J6590_019940 [Homalodisca vitripennis]|nr:hypothetical protein J6590_059294 [Homalodisca vitripennis]KAG8290046.1 hypothetical protein J6590_091600 [Homalodisca vitripennis]KAG8324682.1 hypothetical protein J6590_086677 [Homalodisca vitripennis]KAG8337539.1 hypothetical protein J6590_019940 [Homalodisca vitripennis]
MDTSIIFCLHTSPFSTCQQFKVVKVGLLLPTFSTCQQFKVVKVGLLLPTVRMDSVNQVHGDIHHLLSAHVTVLHLPAVQGCQSRSSPTNGEDGLCKPRPWRHSASSV